MTSKRKQRVVKFIVIIATIALLLTTFLPMLFYMI